MSEKRMLILDAETVEKIEENRGDMSVSEFINFIIDGHLEQNIQPQHLDIVTKEELFGSLDKEGKNSGGLIEECSKGFNELDDRRRAR